jgi:hypothetical protein
MSFILALCGSFNNDTLSVFSDFISALTLAGVRDTMYQLVASREHSKYVKSAVSYTDGSLIEKSAGFTIHRTGVGGFGFKLSSPAGVFSAELSALFIALPHIREVI